MMKRAVLLLTILLLPAPAPAQDQNEYQSYAEYFADCTALYSALADLSHVQGQRQQDTVKLYQSLAWEAREAYQITAEQAGIANPQGYFAQIQQLRTGFYSEQIKEYNAGGKDKLAPSIQACKKLIPVQKKLVAWKKGR